MRFAYADPPYFGQGKRHYGDHVDAARWDAETSHIELLTSLVDNYPDGWVVSLSTPSLSLYLGALDAMGCNYRVGAWVKDWHQYIASVSVQFAWEPVVWSGGRNLKGRTPWVRDWLLKGGSNPAEGATFVGRKPPAFNRWILDLLGYEDGDTLDDLFPGTGGMGRELAQGVLL